MIYTKEVWQTNIRKSRKAYYGSLPDNKKKEFLKHIWSIRNKKDYQSFKWWQQKFPLDFMIE